MNESHQAFDALSTVSQQSVVNGSPNWWDTKDCPNTWEDYYTAKQVVYPDGQMEVCVSKGKHFLGPAFTPSNRAKRGESDNREANDADAGKAAKKRVREACKTIGADRLVTLTYRENMTDREQALKDWKAFCRRLRKNNDFHYVAVIELQERGAIHFHVAVRGRQCYHVLRSIWRSVLGRDADGRTRGEVDVRNPHKFGFGKDGHHKLAAYLAKYCTKSMECRTLDQKRFFTSRGIVRPEVLSWRLNSEATMLNAVEVAFAVASQGNLNGLSFWSNNALGVIWIATAPGQGADNVFSVPF